MVARYEVLDEAIKVHKWTCGAELGVWRGETARYLLQNNPTLSLTLVDTWKAEPYAPKDKTTGVAPYTDQAALDTAFLLVQSIAAEYAGRCKIVRATTCEAAEQVPFYSLDFVFIDANHETKAVLKDYETWRSRVKAGGGIFGHDADWPSVQGAISQIVGAQVLNRGNMWYVKC